MFKELTRITERKIIALLDELSLKCRVEPPEINFLTFEKEVTEFLELVSSTIQVITEPDEKAELSFLLGETLSYLENFKCVKYYGLAHDNFSKPYERMRAIARQVDFWLALGKIDKAEGVLNSVFTKINNPLNEEFEGKELNLAFLKLAEVYYFQSNDENAKEILANELSDELETEVELSKEMLLAQIATEENNFTKGRNHIVKCEKIAKTFEDENDRAIFLRRIAELYVSVDSNVEAKEAYLEIIRILRNDQDLMGLSEIYLELAKVVRKIDPILANEFLGFSLVYGDLSGDFPKSTQNYVKICDEFQEDLDLGTITDYLDLAFKRSLRNKFTRGLTASFDKLKESTKLVLQALEEQENALNEGDLRTRVIRALTQSQGNKSRAASIIGVDNSTFHRYLNNLGINKEKITRRLFKEKSQEEIESYLQENDLILTYSVREDQFEDGLEGLIEEFEKHVIEGVVQDYGTDFKDVEHLLKISPQKFHNLLKKYDI